MQINRTDANFAQFFQQGDLIIWDRKFRLVQPLAEQLGFEVRMPQSREPRQNQLSTPLANLNRAITLIRWPTESAIGRIKNKFKYFSHNIRNNTLHSATDFFKTCCAIVNAYCPPIQSDMPFHPYIANTVNTLINQENALQTFLEENDMINRRVVWEPFDGMLEVEDFPIMDQVDLLQITLGIYQIKQAPSYIAQCFVPNEPFVISRHRDENFQNLLQVRLESRHTASQSYKIFVRFVIILKFVP